MSPPQTSWSGAAETGKTPDFRLQAYESGRIDAAQFGVQGTANLQPGEICGNAIHDLAALNKLKMLPWDQWGRMDASCEGQTGVACGQLLDTIAVVCLGDDTLRDRQPQSARRTPGSLRVRGLSLTTEGVHRTSARDGDGRQSYRRPR